MFNVLNKYLLQHHIISIPGLGSLVAEPIPAVSDFANKRLLPGRIIFRFDKYFDAPDREFFLYLAQQRNTPDYEAIKWYNEFAYDLRNSIRNGEKTVWAGIGEFKKDAGGDIVFEAAPQPFQPFVPVAAERVIRSEAKHTVLVGDREATNTEMAELLGDQVYVEKASWWIYAVVLAALSFCLLFYHLYRTDFRWGFTGNQQSVEVTTPAGN